MSYTSMLDPSGGEEYVGCGFCSGNYGEDPGFEAEHEGSSGSIPQHSWYSVNVVLIVQKVLMALRTSLHTGGNGRLMAQLGHRSRVQTRVVRLEDD